MPRSKALSALDCPKVFREAKHRIGEAGLPGHHLQDQLADVDFRDHLLTPVPQLFERLRFGGGLQRCGMPATLLIDSDISSIRAGRRVLPRRTQLGVPVVEELIGLFWQLK